MNMRAFRDRAKIHREKKVGFVQIKPNSSVCVGQTVASSEELQIEENFFDLKMCIEIQDNKWQLIRP